MDFYDQHILPRLIDLACGGRPLDRVRRQVASRAQGRVLEVGFGSGLNLRHYDAGRVQRVLALEPAVALRELAQPRLQACAIPVEFVEGGAERIALPDASVDSIVVTFTMCSIAEVECAAREMRRVLRPGGGLHFAEHGLGRSMRVQRWQHRLEPVWSPLAGNCHLTRHPPGILAAAGFDVDWAEGLLDTRVLASRTIGPMLYGYWGCAA